MTQVCTVCSHPKREEIDVRLVRGQGSLEGMGREYKLDDQALNRHKINHIPAALSKAHDEQMRLHADRLLVYLGEVTADAERLGAAAEERGDLKTANLALDRRLRCLELLFKAATWQVALTTDARGRTVERFAVGKGPFDAKPLPAPAPGNGAAPEPAVEPADEAGNGLAKRREEMLAKIMGSLGAQEESLARAGEPRGRAKPRK